MKTISVIVRNDLKPGLQAAQAVHAMREFTHQHPEVDLDWFTTSKNLALLQVDSEDRLLDVLGLLHAKGIRCVEWREPDMDDQLTAICVEPDGNRYLSTLPLMLRQAA